MRLRERLWTTDWLALFSALGVAGIGLYFLKSADEAYFYKQTMWLGLGLAVMTVMYFIDYAWLLRHAYSLYAAVMALLVLVLLLPAKRGAQSWIELPGTDLNLQPSELMKFCVILVLARYLMGRDSQDTVRGLILPFLLLLVPLGLILKQPDLGTGILFPPLLFAMLYASGSRLLHLGAVAGAGAATAPLMWIFIMKEYQKNRIRAFLDPEMYSASEAWQLIQSLIAIGSGGLSGMGWGGGSQNSLDLLPDKHTDFIFGVIAEEGGFVAAGSLLLLYLLFVISGLHVARRCREPGGKLIAVGISTVIGVQALVNVGVVTAVLPTTGITLPLISYGGSSMLATFAMLGLLLNISTNREIHILPTKFASLIRD